MRRPGAATSAGSDGDVSSSSSSGASSPSASFWPAPRPRRRLRGQSEGASATGGDLSSASRGRSSRTAASRALATPSIGLGTPPTAPVTANAKPTRRSVRDPEQGVYEYLEELTPAPYPLQGQAMAPVLLPVKLSGWLWRREGLFRTFRRRFCVFKAESSALFVFADDDTLSGKLLRRVVLTRVRLASREDRALHVQGYTQDRELHKKQSDSMAQRASTRARALPGDRQRFFLPQDEHLKAVSAKSLAVWTHCFKHHMKSYRLRQQRHREASDDFSRPGGGLRGSDGDEDEDEDEADDLDPDFVYEEVGTESRRHSLPANPFGIRIERSGSTNGAPTASISSDRAEVATLEQRHARRREHPGDNTQLEYDQDRSIYITKLHRGSFGDDSAAEHPRDQPQASRPPARPAVTPRQQEREAATEPETASETSQSKISQATLSTVMSSATLSSLMWSTQSIWADEALLEHRIDFDAISKSKQLATGAYGEVWLAKYRGRDVVVKHLKELSTDMDQSSTSVAKTNRRAIQRFVEEIKIHMRLDHKRIVSFRGVAWTKERDVQLVMEYLPKGDLRAFLDQVKQVSNNKYSSIWTWTKYQWRIAIDVIEGLVYLHSLSPAVVHSDLKSGNILLREDLAAKLGDFGLSRSVDDCYPLVTNDPNGENDSTLGNVGDADSDGESKKVNQSVAQDGSSSSNSGGAEDNTASGSGWYGRAQGTGRWMAPEVLTGGKSSTMAADVYAFGVVLSEIDTCEVPFRDRSLARSASNVVMSEDVLVHHIVAEAWKPTFRVNCPDAIKALAAECLARDPSDRPTSLEIAHRLRKAASQRERPEVIAAQAASFRIRR